MSHRTRFVTPLLALISILALGACDDDRADGDLTEPGTELSFGQAALVTRSDGAGTMSLAVEEIEEGDRTALEAVAGDAVDGRTPYYVRVEVTPETGDTSITLKEYLNVFSEEDPLTHLSMFVDFEPCQEVAIGPEPPGEPRQTCLIFLGDPDAPAPDAVFYDNGEDFAAADGNAVSWE